MNKNQEAAMIGSVARTPGNIFWHKTLFERGTRISATNLFRLFQTRRAVTFLNRWAQEALNV